MGHPRRMPEHNAVYFITNRLARGLPLVANAYINNIVGGILAKCAKKYQGIVVCHAIFMANHMHLIIYISGDPALLSSFMGYLQGELGKAINRLLGKSVRKVWAQRYNAAKLLTADDSIREITYLYNNPVAANLVATIDEFPGLSTWKQTLGEENYEYKAPRIRELSKLPPGKFTTHSINSLLKSLDDSAEPHRELICKPHAWKRAFASTRNKSDAELQELLVKAVRAGEASYQKEREQNKKGVVGKRSLQLQNPHRDYAPKKFGRRVFCICSCRELREEFISLYKAFCDKCQEVWKSWVAGESDARFPAGAYLPPQRPQASIFDLSFSNTG